MGKQTLMHGQPHRPESSTSEVAFSTFWLSPSHGAHGAGRRAPLSLAQWGDEAGGAAPGRDVVSLPGPPWSHHFSVVNHLLL